MPEIAIYGLGEMGADIARCVVSRGRGLVAYDPVGDPGIESPYFHCGDSVDAVARAAQMHLIVVKRLFDLESLLFDDCGLCASAPKGSVLVLHTTVTPQMVRTLRDRVRDDYEHTLLDVALSRRGGRVSEGSLSLFVGGSEAEFAAARSTLDVYADNVVHAGSIGAGMTVKLCNNWLLYSNRHAALQALKTGRALGIEVDVLRTALASSTGSSWALAHYSAMDEKIVAGRGAPYVVRDRTASELDMVREMTAAVGELPTTLREAFALLDAMEPQMSDVGAPAPEVTAHGFAAETNMRSAIVSSAELPALTRQMPVQLWNSPVVSQVYGHTLNVVCFSRRGAVVGVWVCPLDGEHLPAARRTFRLLPYASPWVEPALHPAVRHQVVRSMTVAVMSRVDAVELPMDPQFGDVAALLEAGVDVLCRHTRILDVAPGRDARDGYLPTVRNHIRAAEKRHTVEVVPPESFDFTRAIVGQPEAAVAARRRSGLAISRTSRTLCLAALDADSVCRGQAFVLRSAGTAILLHLWFDRTGSRGVPSLLVDAAINRAAAELDTPVFDFEGSVIPGIDRFMAGFGAQATAYPHVRWRRRSGSAPQPAVEFG